MAQKKLNPSPRYLERTRYVSGGPAIHDCPPCERCGGTGVQLPPGLVCSGALP
jgi:hypothetical protein